MTKLVEALPQFFLWDLETALVQLGRPDLVEQIKNATLEDWSYDEFADVATLRLAGASGGEGDRLVLIEDVAINLELDGKGRLAAVELMEGGRYLEGLPAELKAAT